MNAEISCVDIGKPVLTEPGRPVQRAATAAFRLPGEVTLDIPIMSIRGSRNH
jgi:hypothetical protein